MSEEQPSFWKRHEQALVAAAIGLGTSIAGAVIARKWSQHQEREDDD